MNTWENDAELFGRAGNKAFLAMLAARCVEEKASGERTDLVKNDKAKTSATQFAKTAGKATNTVKNYIATWDLLADAGHVPSRDELAPGADVHLPAAKVWTEFYRKANPPKPKTGKPDDVTLEQAEAELAADPTVRLLPVPQSRHVATYTLRMINATEDVADRFPDPVANALTRLAQDLEDLADPAQTNRAYLRSMDAVTELVTALGTLR
ncbi:hypothetical protein GCM10009639_47960 [Kitasatospora putterlickiae]|uniref:Uncharacterized protein n=1 Tax=Kitasatospora putterlickiae TaxID=221725 RepID=A0ABN1YBL0_9ACTN